MSKRLSLKILKNPIVENPFYRKIIGLALLFLVGKHYYAEYQTQIKELNL